jgi:fructose-bisphosphate aldolase class I
LHAIKNTGLTVLNSTGFELQESQLIRVFYIDTETFRQLASDGTPFIEMLVEKDIIPGIKVDKGTTALAGFTGEKITEGLDGLRIRLMEYREMGARFAKWRAVIKIGQVIPTPYCINANAHALARYAALFQQCDLVPIVEPEVLMNGDHNINQCREVTEATLNRVFFELNADQKLFH